MHQKLTFLAGCIFLLLPGIFYGQLSLSNPPATAALFGKGMISTRLNERDMAISPDGRELFYTVVSPQNTISVIMYMQKNDQGQWSKPRTASFSGHYSDLEPAFSPDGKKLFFVSNRPLHGDTLKDFDIWCLSRQNGEWTNAVNIGEPVNTAVKEFYPSVAANGNLYFTASYAQGKGREDIYVSKWVNGKYTSPVSLDTGVNSSFYEFNAYVSPDEQFILFSSFGRKDDKGGGDLYYSVKDSAGNWAPAKNCTALNSDKLDYCPFVSFDKKILFFTSERGGPKDAYPAQPLRYTAMAKQFDSVLNGLGNIYWIRWDKFLQLMK